MIEANDTVIGTVSMKTAWNIVDKKVNYGFYFDFLPSDAFMAVKYDTQFALGLSKEVFGAKTESYVFLRKNQGGLTLHTQVYNTLNEPLIQLNDIGITDAFFDGSGEFKFVWPAGKEKFASASATPPETYFALDQDKCFFDEETGRFQMYMTKQNAGVSEISVGKWSYLGVLLDAGDAKFRAPLKLVWAKPGTETCVAPVKEEKTAIDGNSDKSDGSSNVDNSADAEGAGTISDVN